MSSHNLNSNHNNDELWFTKFFIGSMVAIAMLTVVLCFLPSPRNSPQIKTSLIELQGISAVA